MNLEGIAGVVTGGASGLGRATVERFVKAGCRVLILDLDGMRGRALSDQLGPDAAFVEADVTDEEAVASALDTADQLGEVRVCVNCAGIGVEAARTVGHGNVVYPLESFARAVNVNLIGTFNVTRLAAARMGALNPVDVDGLRGVVVNTASVAAMDGQTGQVAYTAAKAGVVGMTLPLARDLSAIGVRVCTIAPGNFDTPIFEWGGATREQIETFQKLLLVDNAFPRRLGRAEEFASLVEEIVRNDMLNGETIRLDAGARLRANPGR